MYVYHEETENTSIILTGVLALTSIAPLGASAAPTTGIEAKGAGICLLLKRRTFHILMYIYVIIYDDYEGIVFVNNISDLE
ncbi:hypothetical protein BK134_10235 [Paenibacillus peoriae]|uniref:Uncharacterized protein n=1 Tax=Paenibacillus polymyxa TaxID=1406 RepID=A0ABX2ZIC9_PAEPO|nr:hypothetical protein A7312_03965 [Paenibacillus polymyxa]OME65928.1 hypothetical protein BK119_23660 [Paenibacillus peoriae]OMF34075.1 hypothetical protein BK134_10235 [Paenibacillus peoriae]